MARIDLPYKWSPRDYQIPSWSAFRECNEKGGLRKFFKIWHRRAGKDDVDLHHNACSAFERVGNYWYMLPEYNQCRKAIWSAINPHSGKKRIDEAFPHAIRSKTLEQEMKIEFANGSTFQLMGSDNVDSLVGSPPIGLTYSEYGISNPQSWGYLRPILLENDGWAAFNTTPRGKNHAYRLALMAEKSDEWFYEKLTVDSTSVFTAKQLQNELDELVSEHGEEYGKALWLQEYYCSFEAAVPGSIWGDATTKLENEGRLTTVEHTEGYPVHSGWDLGKDDDTAIWFYQVVGNELKVLDYYSKNFKDPDYFAEYLRDHGKENGWRYGTHWLPHDAKHDRQGMYGRTILTQFMEFALQIEQESGYDIGNFRIVPSISKQNGIQAGRQMLKIAYFDKENCELGFEHLKSYHRKYDRDKNKFSEDAEHDGHSHACVVGDTEVLTTNGIKQIKDIKNGDKVRIGEIEGIVSNSGIVGRKKTIKLHFDDNSVLECTKDHKILTDNGLVYADALRYDMRVLTAEDLECVKKRILIKTGVRSALNTHFKNLMEKDTTDVQKEDIFSISKSVNTCTGLFGRLLMEKYLKNTISIISMMINQTIALITFSASPLQTTQSTTLQRANGLEVKEIKNSLLRHKKKQKNGMPQRKEENGTLNMARKLGLIVKQQLNNVIGAIKTTKPIIQQSQSSAITTAKHLLYVSEGRVQNVYDLTIDHHHAYVANGILVSNSDAWRYVALTWKESKKEQKVVSPHQKLINGNIAGMTMGNMIKKHFKNKNRQRNDLWK